MHIYRDSRILLHNPVALFPYRCVESYYSNVADGIECTHVSNTFLIIFNAEISHIFSNKIQTDFTQKFTIFTTISNAFEIGVNSNIFKTLFTQNISVVCT